MRRRRFLLSLAAAAQAAGAPQAAGAQAPVALPGRDPKSLDADLGSLSPWIEKQWAAHRHELSFLQPRFRRVEQWQRQVRPLILERLFYRPPPAPAAARVLERAETPDFIREKIEFSTTADFRVPAYVHIPRRVKLPAPGLVVLHDHGGFYYFGKEKVTERGSPAQKSKDNTKAERHKGHKGKPKCFLVIFVTLRLCVVF